MFISGRDPSQKDVLETCMPLAPSVVREKRDHEPLIMGALQAPTTPESKDLEDRLDHLERSVASPDVPQIPGALR